MLNIRSAFSARPAFYLTIAVYLILNACANPVMPTGGPKDSTPPKIIKTIPRDRSINFNSNRIEIEFNEYVKLNTGSNKILVSPPMKENPVYKLKGKSLVIELKEKLIDSLTYSFFFTDAIQDITEGNSIEPFSYVFSTGPHIDSLVLSGTQLAAQTGKPEEGVFVGLWPIQDSIHPIDSLPLLNPPRYLAVATKEGIWQIQNIAEGKYQLLAFKDVNSSFTYDRFAEMVGYPDSLVKPFYIAPPKRQEKDSTKADSSKLANKETVADTVSKSLTHSGSSLEKSVNKQDSINYHVAISDSSVQATTLDSISSNDSSNRGVNKVSQTKNFPKIELTMFQEIDSTQRFLGFNLLRTNQGQLSWRMPLNEPTFEFQPPVKDTIIYKWSAKFDTLTMWLPGQNTDSLKLIVRDKLKVADTIIKSWTAQAPVNRGKKKTAIEKLKITLKTEVGKVRYYEPFTLRFDQPVQYINQDSAILLYSPKDTTLLAFHKSDSLGMTWQSDRIPEALTNYRVIIKDSTFISVLGIKNKKEDISATSTGPEMYGQLIINLNDFEKGSWFFELLDEKDKKLKTIVPEDRKLTISKLLPAKYKLRAIFDRNRNGIWDPGEYFAKKQPETILYYPQLIEIRANWDLEEQWLLPSSN